MNIKFRLMQIGAIEWFIGAIRDFIVGAQGFTQYHRVFRHKCWRGREELPFILASTCRLALTFLDSFISVPKGSNESAVKENI